MRTIDEISKKWKSLKSEALSNVHSQSKTGGGPADKPTPYLDLVLDIIGKKVMEPRDFIHVICAANMKYGVI